MSVVIPGNRDVRATHAQPGTETNVIVVAAPPHPQHGGSRHDGRLVTLAETLTDSGIACLRFDYGAWDEGYGECEDVCSAVWWAAERYERVGLFGYSFGATLALLAAADLETDGEIDAVSALAPTARLAADLDALEALEVLEVPVQIQYGERDTSVEWEPIVDRATDRGDDVSERSAGHFFAGQEAPVADAAQEFFERTLMD
ncbi:alpha/beta hydrolase [Salinadaptatus halalkaliphilus]|uniref:Alpha/beta hydrolase n=2 Tax=Salinadaptatus halalkaliphilus TaxID=2419781 RepID=A0A4S3TR14_9EURY|nr:alpha/beta hydrolase [Salinadaptatus halalkaliphilus]